MKNRTITKEQLRELEGLAYWIADKNYIIERYGVNDPEVDRCHKTIILIFDKLDELETPFLIQNMVICWAENWRNYKEQYTRNYLKGRGVTVAG